uniref:WW domain-containing protein n=1 Tax=Rhizophora mucronata TaxID=61149 RepID=A0A2P2IWE9_RHIMU
MVSFQATPGPSPDGRKQIMELDNSSKKRKWEEPKTEDFLELHLDTPLPSKWQRCPDVQSGQTPFYTTGAYNRTSRDPSPEPPSTGHNHTSLDLELNLTCDAHRKDQVNNHVTRHISSRSTRPAPALGDFILDSSKAGNKISGGGLKPPCPSWLAFEKETDQQDMVATVCTRCYMLVMLCKSSPACPNCKFLHPPDQSPPKLFK